VQLGGAGDVSGRQQRQLGPAECQWLAKRAHMFNAPAGQPRLQQPRRAFADDNLAMTPDVIGVRCETKAVDCWSCGSSHKSNFGKCTPRSNRMATVAFDMGWSSGSFRSAANQRV